MTSTSKQAGVLPTGLPPSPPAYSDAEDVGSEYRDEEYRLLEIAKQMRDEFGESDGDTFQAIINLGNFYEKHKMFRAAISQYEQLCHGIALSGVSWDDLSKSALPWFELRLQGLHFSLRCYRALGKLRDVLQNELSYPFLVAVHVDYQPLLNFLIAEMESIDEHDDWRDNAIVWAVRAGHETFVRQLLDKGADKDTKDDSSTTILILAASSGHDSIVRLLLERGAVTEGADTNRAIAFRIASQMGDDAAAKKVLLGEDEKIHVEAMARLMELVARKSDLELQQQMINQAKLQVANMTSALFNIGQSHKPAVEAQIRKLQQVFRRLEKQELRCQKQQESVILEIKIADKIIK
jgi:Ankyrin repeats (3 copies)